MTATTAPTYRSLRITGDFLAEDADFTRFATFDVLVAVDADGRYSRWNGFVESPLFPYEEAKRLAKWLDDAIAETPDARFDRLSFVEDEDGFVDAKIVPGDPEAYEGIDTHLNGTFVGDALLFDLGLGWTWYEASEEDETSDERGTGPDRYPTILRDASGRPVDIG